MPRGGVEVQLYSFFNLGARWGEWLTPRLGRFTPMKETRYPLYRRLDGPQGRSGPVRKIHTPPEFDPRTVQLVASRCTHYVIPAQITTYFYFVIDNAVEKRWPLKCHDCSECRMEVWRFVRAANEYSNDFALEC